VHGDDPAVDVDNGLDVVVRQRPKIDLGVGFPQNVSSEGDQER
jgi:hypothetical protein